MRYTIFLFLLLPFACTDNAPTPAPVPKPAAEVLSKAPNPTPAPKATETAPAKATPPAATKRVSNGKIPAIWQNRHPWGSYPIGSSVNSERAMGGQKIKAVKRLKGINGGIISLEVESDLGMGVPRVNTLKMPIDVSFPVHGGIPMGSQTLKIDGKDVSCEKFVIIGDESTKTSDKPFTKERGVCVNDTIKVPLQLWEFAEYNTIAYDTKVTAASLTDEIEVGTKKVKAVRLEGELKKGSDVAGLTRWLSADVPGWLVRENRVDSKGVVTERVTGFSLGTGAVTTP